MPEQEQILIWKSHPLTENTLKTSALFVVLAVVLYAIYFAFNTIFFVALSAVVLFFSLLRYFFPTRYQADARGISVSFLGVSKFRQWSSFGNVYVHTTGVHLAPFEKPSALDPFRGIFLLFGNSDRDRIVDFVKKYVQRKEESVTALKDTDARPI